MSLKTRRKFPRDLKLQALRELDSGKPAAQICREYGVLPSCLVKWRHDRDQHGEQAFPGNGNPIATTVPAEDKTADLERLIGQLTIENAFLKKVLARQEAMRNVKP